VRGKEKVVSLFQTVKGKLGFAFLVVLLALAVGLDSAAAQIPAGWTETAVTDEIAAFLGNSMVTWGVLFVIALSLSVAVVRAIRRATTTQ
jgi:heme/copper-type cytochrome/quinol oxidase subunit 2